MHMQMRLAPRRAGGCCAISLSGKMKSNSSVRMNNK